MLGGVPAETVLYTIRPVAFAAVPAKGENELVAVKMTRGGRKPKVDELTSNLAEALGEVVPIPVWAKE